MGARQAGPEPRAITPVRLGQGDQSAVEESHRALCQAIARQESITEQQAPERGISRPDSAARGRPAEPAEPG
ncbi:hypothetical protein Msi02_46410 [Microbispora siamensis]|uniref:Uncharacterized protein n=1 Tax=Microbispora siamensis TaxID=564413 RepID=A0ABQ4GR48_9ACTN|nr:hypothetical protein Msi02_46410 [Microbispora siamensis]